MTEYRIKQTCFNDDSQAIESVREQVFIKEQHVPIELEWDGLDEGAIHLLVTDDEGLPLATCRMLDDGHIGRMAVLASWRNRGIGSAMLHKLVNMARSKGLSAVFLSAQVEAIDFYRKNGFTVTSDTYMDAGIPHRDMRMELS